jgi:hypothetical protein
VTIFDYLKDIIVTKHGNLTLEAYVPFLVNRWLSFIDPNACEYVNLTFNNKTLLENKELHYKAMVGAFPRAKRCPRMNYIKKVKEKEQEVDKKVKYLAQSLEISEREALLLFDKSGLE